MLSERIREGQDIYFVCRCDSNPATNEITWLHNDRPIKDSTPVGGGSLAAYASRPADEMKDRLGEPSSPPSASSVSSAGSASVAPSGGQTANLIVSNDSLVLQRVQIEQSGQYSCLTSNTEGVGLSNQIELRVLRKWMRNGCPHLHFATRSSRRLTRCKY